MGEECTEVVIAAKGGDRDETIFEIADLTYHVLVLMAEYGITLNDIRGSSPRATSWIKRSNRKRCSNFSASAFHAPRGAMRRKE